MTRYSSDVLDTEGVVRQGHDYNVSVWVEDYIIQRCGHRTFQDRCNGCLLHGQDIRTIDRHERRKDKE